MQKNFNFIAGFDLGTYEMQKQCSATKLSLLNGTKFKFWSNNKADRNCLFNHRNEHNLPIKKLKSLIYLNLSLKLKTFGIYEVYTYVREVPNSKNPSKFFMCSNCYPERCVSLYWV